MVWHVSGVADVTLIVAVVIFITVIITINYFRDSLAI